MNGQVVGADLPLADTSDGYIACLMLPSSDSLDRRHWNTYVTERMEALDRAGVSGPSVVSIGIVPSSYAPCACEPRTALALFTTYISLESPLRCLTCFRPVPLYQVPPTRSGEYGDIISWQSNYQACDTLQMNCTVGERFGTRQISALDSSLTKQGLQICAAIAAATTLPTYYYLCRGSGRSWEAERARMCPSCAGAWLLAEPLHERFDFQCERCHLLSNVAWSVRLQ